MNQNAFIVAQEAIGEPKFITDKTLLSQVMAEMGRKGGKKGGKRRLETMSPEQRSQIALKAAKARWGKRKRLS